MFLIIMSINSKTKFNRLFVPQTSQSLFHHDDLYFSLDPPPTIAAHHNNSENQTLLLCHSVPTTDGCDLQSRYHYQPPPLPPLRPPSDGLEHQQPIRVDDHRPPGLPLPIRLSPRRSSFARPLADWGNKAPLSLGAFSNWDKSRVNRCDKKYIEIENEDVKNRDFEKKDVLGSVDSNEFEWFPNGSSTPSILDDYMLDLLMPSVEPLLSSRPSKSTETTPHLEAETPASFRIANQTWADQTWAPLLRPVSLIGNEALYWTKLTEVSGPLGALHAALKSDMEQQSALEVHPTTSSDQIQSTPTTPEDQVSSTAPSTPKTPSIEVPAAEDVTTVRKASVKCFTDSGRSSFTSASGIPAVGLLRRNRRRLSNFGLPTRRSLRKYGRKSRSLEMSSTRTRRCDETPGGSGGGRSINLDNGRKTDVDSHVWRQECIGSHQQNPCRIQNCGNIDDAPSAAKRPSAKALRKKLERLGQQRGSLELNKIIGTFSRKCVPLMTYEQLRDFEKVLEIENSVIFGILSCQFKIPEEFKSSLALPLLLTFINPNHPNLSST